MVAPTDDVQPPDGLAFIAAQRVGSDTRLLTLLDDMYKDPAGFAALKNANEIRRTILGFKYWVDEPGADSIRYWAEGPSLTYNVCAYLAGHFFEQDFFVNSGGLGSLVAQRAETRIRSWLGLCFRRGMNEWLTARTLVDVLATLIVLVDRAPDEDLAQRAAMVTDLLLLDVAMHSFEGDFAPAAARDTRGRGPVSVLSWLRETPSRQPTDPLVARIVEPGAYTVPTVIQAVAYDQVTSLSRSTFGINPAEVARETAGRSDEAALLAWRIGAYTCPETWKASLDGFRRFGLSRHPALRPVRKHAASMARFFPLQVRPSSPRRE